MGRTGQKLQKGSLGKSLQRTQKKSATKANDVQSRWVLIMQWCLCEAPGS
jgi:hypothetical protein